jgi:hypothetical protein
MTQLIGTEQLTGEPVRLWTVRRVADRVFPEPDDVGAPSTRRALRPRMGEPKHPRPFPPDQVPRTPAVSVFPSPGSRISLPQGRRYGVHHGRE